MPIENNIGKKTIKRDYFNKCEMVSLYLFQQFLFFSANFQF